jgi:hypothetical protein
MVIYEQPWKHITFDDYLSTEEYARVCKEILQYIVNNKNSLKQQTLLKSTDNLATELPATYAILAPKSIKHYLSLFDNHRSFDALDEYFEVNMCFNNLAYRIHDEAANKVLSLVTYILPKQSNGTFIYNENKQFVKEIEWQPNHSLLFAALDNITWHNYKSDAFRVTINRFLTRDIY